MANRPIGETFVNDAEQLLRESLKGREDLVIWRGTHPHKHISEYFDYDTLLVGFVADSAGKPTRILAKIWKNRPTGMCYDFSTGKDNSSSGGCPFSAHDPFEYVKEAAAALLKTPVRTPITDFLDQAEDILNRKLHTYSDFVLWRGRHEHRIGGETHEHETILVGLSDSKNANDPPELVLLTVYADLNTRVRLEAEAGCGPRDWTGGFGGIGMLSGVWEASLKLEDFFKPAPAL